LILQSGRHRWFPAFCVALLLAVLMAQLAFSLRRETQTWSEACHLFAGYSYWTRADFGMNPEHPPLVKLLAALPLWPMSIRVPEVGDRNFKVEASSPGSSSFTPTTPTRSCFAPLLLALLVFVATREMFGNAPAFVALALLVFDPNLLAHGALVTTARDYPVFSWRRYTPSTVM